MISIILPNLNTPIIFLEERVKTIKEQSFNEWECIIIDGFSDNGSAEYLKNLSLEDGRFLFNQRERKGIYDAWNEGIKVATRKFIYIATSDDTMSNDFFKKMLSGFKIAPECDIACCSLIIIDENSKPINGADWEKFSAGRYFTDYLNGYHIRKAPHDGILHSIVGMVYTSVTQLLIKKDVFDKIGLFLVNKGAIADFEWEMRASLLTDIIYIPERLATWRKHSGQATIENYNNYLFYESLVSLIKQAYGTAIKINPLLKKQISFKESLFPFSLEMHRFGIKEAKGLKNKIKKIFTCIISRPDIGIHFILEIMHFKERFESINHAKSFLKYNGVYRKHI